MAEGVPPPFADVRLVDDPSEFKIRYAFGWQSGFGIPNLPEILTDLVLPRVTLVLGISLSAAGVAFETAFGTAIDLTAGCRLDNVTLAAGALPQTVLPAEAQKILPLVAQTVKRVWGEQPARRRERCPLGKAAWATRAVFGGTGSIGIGRSLGHLPVS